jgi:hypothetical protein
MRYMKPTEAAAALAAGGSPQSYKHDAETAVRQRSPQDQGMMATAPQRTRPGGGVSTPDMGGDAGTMRELFSPATR